MASVQELLRMTADIPGDSSARDLEILLGHCLDKPRTWLYTWPEVDVDGAAASEFLALLERRRQGEPVAYLTGQRDFWSLQLAVDDSTLIPRPDTETLVEWVLELQLSPGAAVLDLGAGTGAIALAIASERPHWQVTGLDANADAVALALRNAASNGLQRVSFLQSDWFTAVAGTRFELLVSNPPYVDEVDPHLACGDVRFEPRSALVAGAGGMADIEHIIARAPEHLHPGGWLLLEHGYEQGSVVRERLRERGFTAVTTHHDLAGLERISGGCWHAD